jgi:hypothetical protein
VANDADNELMSNTYPRFQTPVNRVIVVDNKCKEMDAKRKRLREQASGSNTRQRTGFQQGNQQRYPPGQWNRGQFLTRNQFPQRLPFQPQNGNQHPQQQNGSQTQHQGTPNNTPMKNNAPSTPNTCYRCGEVGHYANHCPKKQQPPQSQNNSN